MQLKKMKSKKHSQHSALWEDEKEEKKSQDSAL